MRTALLLASSVLLALGLASCGQRGGGSSSVPVDEQEPVTGEWNVTSVKDYRYAKTRSGATPYWFRLLRSVPLTPVSSSWDVPEGRLAEYVLVFDVFYDIDAEALSFAFERSGGRFPHNDYQQYAWDVAVYDGDSLKCRLSTSSDTRYKRYRLKEGDVGELVRAFRETGSASLRFEFTNRISPSGTPDFVFEVPVGNFEEAYAQFFLFQDELVASGGSHFRQAA